MKQRNRTRDMTQGPIIRQVLLFALPLMIGNVFQMLYNTVDVIVVGNYVGREALAAVGSTTMIVNVQVFFFNGFSIGAGVVVGQYFGAKEYEKLHTAVETSGFCSRDVLLAALPSADLFLFDYKATGEEAHRAMLYRVTADLARLRHPNGGYRESDTGYKAACARTAAGECSLLTENGDPVADLLYSVNWLPIGFATAWRATGDAYFYGLWRDIAAFCIASQMHADAPAQDGAWCRAFDLELGEACGCPHDAGWGPLCSESGWTDAEILMGLMLPDIFAMKDLEKTQGGQNENKMNKKRYAAYGR